MWKGKDLKKWYWLGGIGICLVFVGLSLYVYKRQNGLSFLSSSSSPSKNVSVVSSEELMKAIRLKKKSPEYLLFEGQNLNALREGLDPKSKPENRLKLLQAGILFMDTEGVKSWPREKVLSLIEGSLWLIQPKTTEKGRELRDFNKQKSLSFHFLKRLLRVASSEEINKKLLQSLAASNQSEDGYEKSILMDLFTSMESIPPLVVTDLEKCALEKEHALAINCLGYIDQVQNLGQREVLLGRLVGNKEKVVKEGWPLLIKMVFSNHDLSKRLAAQAEKFLKEIAGEKKEEYREVFLYGVEVLKQQKNYKKELQSIAQDSSYPLLQKRAEVILQKSR